jgi:hypothetical protein
VEVKRQHPFMQIYRVCRKEPLLLGGFSLTLSFQATKPWDPDLGKEFDLTWFLGFIFYFKNLVFRSVLTCVRTGIPVSSQGITQGDTLRGSERDAQVMPRGVCDTSSTLQKAVLKGELLIWRTKNQARDQGRVQRKNSIWFKSVQIGS